MFWRALGAVMSLVVGAAVAGAGFHALAAARAYEHAAPVHEPSAAEAQAAGQDAEAEGANATGGPDGAGDGAEGDPTAGSRPVPTAPPTMETLREPRWYWLTASGGITAAVGAGVFTGGPAWSIWGGRRPAQRVSGSDDSEE